jgi:hypothetical protein
MTDSTLAMVLSMREAVVAEPQILRVARAAARQRTNGILPARPMVQREIPGSLVRCHEWMVATRALLPALHRPIAGPRTE